MHRAAGRVVESSGCYVHRVVVIILWLRNGIEPEVDQLDYLSFLLDEKCSRILLVFGQETLYALESARRRGFVGRRRRGTRPFQVAELTLNGPS